MGRRRAGLLRLLELVGWRLRVNLRLVRVRRVEHAAEQVVAAVHVIQLLQEVCAGYLARGGDGPQIFEEAVELAVGFAAALGGVQQLFGKGGVARVEAVCHLDSPAHPCKHFIPAHGEMDAGSVGCVHQVTLRPFCASQMLCESEEYTASRMESRGAE